MNRDEALAKLHEWVETPSLRRHCYTVEHVMRRAATRYGTPADDPEQWATVGLLHDADYEKFPNEHPNRIAAWLRERGEEAMAHAIECHVTRTGVTCNSQLDKSLIACDELTGFIVACCWMRPDGILTLEPPSVLKKLKDKKFAAGVSREDVALGVQLLGVELSNHVGFVIESLKERAEEFGLTKKE